MTTRLPRLLAALCGVLGTAALIAYYAAPWTFVPLPANNATAAEVIAFGARYHTVILWDVWFQAIGSLLTIVFVLALVHLAGAAERFAGRFVLLVSAVIMGLSLAEGTFALGAVQAGTNGHPEAAVACFDLTNVFIHIFLLAPSLFLVLGFALLGTRLLPSAFSYLAIALGVVFQVLGVAGLFSTAALLVVIAVLMAQNVWTIAAAIALAVRTDPPAANTVPRPLPATS
ncbi:MAG: hypothetical protein ACTHNK_18130 [Thermomicrobiales bacterium]